MSRYQLVAVGVAIVGGVIGLIGAVSDVDHFFHIYFLAIMFWLQIALGCLGVVLLLNLLSSPWGFAVRRIAEAGARTLPLVALLFLPVLLGMGRIFPWAEAGAVVDGNKGLYLTPGFFVLRAVLYFAIWIVLAYVLTGWSYTQDTSRDPNGLTRRAQPIALLGMILYFLTTTFAAFDWLMSIEKDWFSSIIGWLFIAQQVLATVPLIILILAALWNKGVLSLLTVPQTLVDLGSLLLVGLLAWTYLSYIQYIVIWSGNLDKISWYVTRSNGVYGGIVIFMAIFHAVAFLLLIIPGLKQYRSIMISVAALLLVMRFVEMYWFIMPSLSESFAPRWWDLALVLAFGGGWFAVFLWSLAGHPLVPLKHPQLPKAVAAPDEEAEAKIAV